MSRRGRSTVGEEEIGHELNLIPYLDIMVNLVLFMLVTIVSFLSFTILNASIPQLNTGRSEAIAAAQGEDLLLILRIEKSGYTVEPTVTGGDPINKRTFKMVDVEGQSQKGYDFAALKDFMVTLKDRFPKENKILIISNAEIQYDDIIHTMDAVRETKAGEEDLFAEVTLSI